MLRANWLVAQIYKAREYNALQIGSITIDLVGIIDIQ